MCWLGTQVSVIVLLCVGLVHRCVIVLLCVDLVHRCVSLSYCVLAWYTDVCHCPTVCWLGTQVSVIVLLCVGVVHK